MKNIFVISALFSIVLLGCTKEEQKQPVNTILSASFDYEQMQYAPCWIYFTNTSKNAITVIWDLGSGFDTYDKYNLKKWYDKAGSYPISIRAYGYNGDSVTTSKNITVK